jgi:hypothetical protein
MDHLGLKRSPAQWNTTVHIDVIGVGASVFDGCAQFGLNANGVNFGEGTTARDASGQLPFANVRAKVYWTLREFLDPAGEVKIALPPDPELLADLAAPRWCLQAGRIKIESKEDIVKRLGRSPDCADAIVLANMEATASYDDDVGGVGSRESGRRR